ncbi:hypothetical protein [Psychrobacter sp. I-STPA6b]|uniref:hypothetical protein n=1 Tax=Psychrobacter sp. I-STPA6b TaxID=2585718 RepID=UPI001D0C5ACD|nr:hypothetical protein [Psychrobacter sp. I-STPA6b]
MKEINIGLPNCYKSVYKRHDSENLVITFTPTNGYFLYHNDLNAHKICISTSRPNYYIYNPGSACKRLISYIKTLNIKNIIVIGSSKAGLASLLWGELLHRGLSNRYNIFVLSFSPQTLLYPFNDRLYFPSYQKLVNMINNNKGMLKCAENYGDINNILANSSLEGIVIYPKLNLCDKEEAERICATNIRLVGLEYPLHGSFVPFMKQAKDPEALKQMVSKIYKNAKQDQDLKVTIPSTETELLNIISSIKAPTIEELCQAVFFSMNNKRELKNYTYVKGLGLV